MDKSNIDVGDLVKLLDWMEGFLAQRATMRRIEMKLDQLLITTRRTDMTAAEEEEVLAKQEELKQIAEIKVVPT